MITKQRDYLSLHIFYNTTDLRNVLLDCVDPLIQRLEAADMLSSYFFVRYWESGCHVRLRLMPGDGVTHDDIRSEAEPVIRGFLEENPSLFDADPEVMRSLMRSLFTYEYGPQEFDRVFGPEGNIPLADNNSFQYVPYQPEYGRYGGVEGIELSEQHFHVSSKIALESLRESNSHVRTSTLGLALQLMFHFVFAFYEDKERVIGFFRHYAQRWHELSVPQKYVEAFDRLYQMQEAQILSHFAQVNRLHSSLETSDSGVLGKWLRHAYYLRENITRLFAEGKLDLKPAALTVDEAIRRLLTSYIHMMNNRLGVLILEEIYMAHLIIKALSREA